MTHQERMEFLTRNKVWINFIKNNYDNIKREQETLNGNVYFLRNYLAENGKECTPDEIKSFLEIIDKTIEDIENEGSDTEF